jgi:hypothetical protein
VLRSCRKSGAEQPHLDFRHRGLILVL